jgi:hypothetical protein
VARSLHKRDGTSRVRGEALWEHYNLAALEGMRGMDVFVLDYEALVVDRNTAVASLAAWLETLEQFADLGGHWDLDRAASLVTGDTRRQRPDDEVGLPPHLEQERLTERLADLAGGHRCFDPGSLPAESSWTQEILANRREARLAELRVHQMGFLEHQVGVLEHQVGALDAQLASTRHVLEATRHDLEDITRALNNMADSTSWRITKPLRVVTARVRGRLGLFRGTKS